MIDIINLFAGFDARQEFGFHTFMSSVVHQCSLPISITPIGNALLHGLSNGQRKDESTDFTHARFLIPWLCGWKGWALFVDGVDMVVRADLAELWSMRDPYCAVQIVRHDYKTKHPLKFVGTFMETENRDYKGKNWSSVMLINCSHFSWRNMYPDEVRKLEGAKLHRFDFIEDKEKIGELPAEWNWLADEYGPNANARLLHFTAGIPAFAAYSSAPMADEWTAAALKVTHVTE